MEDKLLEIMDPMQAFAETMIYDNGKEFALHKAISKALETSGYFAH